MRKIEDGITPVRQIIFGEVFRIDNLELVGNEWLPNNIPNRIVQTLIQNIVLLSGENGL